MIPENELQEIEHTATDPLVKRLVGEIRHLQAEREAVLYELWYLHPRFAQERFGYTSTTAASDNQNRSAPLLSPEPGDTPRR
jgi:hypothetical protein